MTLAISLVVLVLFVAVMQLRGIVEDLKADAEGRKRERRRILDSLEYRRWD